MDNPFSADSLAKSVHDLPEIPLEEAHVGVVAKNGDVGVEGAVNHELGKGVSVAAEGSWYVRKGWEIAAVLGWKRK